MCGQCRPAAYDERIFCTRCIRDAQPLDDGPRAPRPKASLGLRLIAWSMIGIALSAVGLAVWFLFSSAPVKVTGVPAEEIKPWTKPVLVAISVLFALPVLAINAGLLRLRPWARYATLLFAGADVAGAAYRLLSLLWHSGATPRLPLGGILFLIYFNIESVRKQFAPPREKGT